MKKLLAITLLLSACGSNNSKPAIETQKKPTIEVSKNPIIGTTKKLGSIEIAEKDFPKVMTWDEAKAACAELGNGWRLPTQEELNDMYLNNNKVGCYASGIYWSSSEFDDSTAWSQFFSSGFQDVDGKSFTTHVRAVRAF